MPAILDPRPAEPVIATSASANVRPALCPLCGAPLDNPACCDRCDWVQGYGDPAPEMRRNPRDLFACILSLFWPGAGHFYKGHARIAFVLAALGLLCFLWSLTFLMFFGFLCLPAYWAGVAANAYFLKDLKHTASPSRPREVQQPHPAH